MKFKEIEEKILEFWKKNKIFEKSVKESKNKPFFSFYDGPPFLSGRPHYGHILATAIKDTVARYKTMKGFNVPRRVGWDCHGLPIENLIEKEFGIKSKREIEKIGLAKFNEACRQSVFSSLNIFEKTLERVGRWADYKNAYMTLDNSYIESVWWVLKKLWEKNLVYRDYRVTPYCPRCGTPLSNFEVNLGYKEAKDPSIFIKFPLKNSQNEFFLVWTTTPWTLPSNLALAVGGDIEYLKIKIKQTKELFYLAKERISLIKDDYEIVKEMKGSTLLGMEYEPLFNFAKPDKKSYFVIEADFVSTEEGTGIVHIAPAFGIEDMEVGKLNDLPILNLVDSEGRFIDLVKPWAGMFVKEADKLIIEDLKKRHLLFREEIINHIYPFCWRCDSPLLYYPLETFYIAVEKIKREIVENNKKINWVPAHIKEGRFGKWLEGAKDWAFSRSRFWGAPVPVWRCQKCGQEEIIGSLIELREQAVSSGNKYFLMRHGEAENNVKKIINCQPAEKERYSLTEKGRQEVLKAAEFLKRKKIDFIFASDFLRTKKSVYLVADALGLAPSQIKFDERLREINVGYFNGRSPEEYHSFFSSFEEKFYKNPPGGENLNDLKRRIAEFLKEMESSFNHKNILIISHEYPLWMFEAVCRALNEKEAISLRASKGDKDFIKTGEVRETEYLSLPRNRNSSLDLHRPYIDGIFLTCEKCGGLMERIAEVFDCWFESGSMPYAQYHYPFENKTFVEETFPADFIAEGLDQTRGWFYTLHVLATALTLEDIGLGKGQPAFKNVIVNGLILDSQGRKLSKKLRNYTEPDVIIDKFGADALRLYLLSSTALGDDYLFSDKGVEETMRKTTDTFLNIFSFLKIYFYQDKLQGFNQKELKFQIIDEWMFVRLKKAAKEIIEFMEKYDLTRASRVFLAFFDDFSNWYLRRSRQRFQRPESLESYQSAFYALFKIALDVSRLFAPFAPFLSEYIYQELKKISLNSFENSFDFKESVHLDNYPSFGDLSKKEEELLAAMEEARMIVSEVLDCRLKNKIKVRQPLALLKVKPRSVLKNFERIDELLFLIKDEVNVKKIIFDEKLKEDFELDLNLTAELKEEGVVRELIRKIQDFRKKLNLAPNQKVVLFIQTDEKGKKLLERFSKLIYRSINISSLVFGDAGDMAGLDKEVREVEIEGWRLKIGIKKNNLS